MAMVEIVESEVIFLSIIQGLHLRMDFFCLIGIMEGIRPHIFVLILKKRTFVFCIPVMALMAVQIIHI